MSTLFFDNLLPIQYSDTKFVEPYLIYNDVQFLEDFGPFKKKNIVSVLLVNFIDGTVIEGGDENNVRIRECKVKFVVGRYNEDKREGIIDIIL